MFPQRLDSTLAYDIAQAMLDGFSRHYQLYRSESARARYRVETAFWRRHKERIQQGCVDDVFPYDHSRRFSLQRSSI